VRSGTRNQKSAIRNAQSGEQIDQENIIKTQAKHMAYIAGIDEAGRGPVIGPMVMAIVACEDQQELKRLGMKDSKLLTPAQRETLAQELRAKEIGFEIISLTPAEIDAAVHGKAQGDNLNNLEARTAALLIHRLAKRMPISEVILDSPTRTTSKYETAVRAALNKLDAEGTKQIMLRAECKADFNHPVVGAASILAKTTRDAAIAAIAAEHGKIGSGYPSDPDTQAFLNDHWREQHDFFRKSWESYQRLAGGERGQASLAEFSESSEERQKAEAKRFEPLLRHGFRFEAPTNKYEMVRMRNDEGVTVISYNTGKLVVQGADPVRDKALALIASLGIGSAVEQKRPRGRPRKNP
jgi:ribonuclease HII